ncbi:MAG: 3-isopropylmalate dehydratase small subunit [Fimbriimonadaceae bacterium]
MVQPFVRHSGRIAVYEADNVDTDRIIPARFLSLVTRAGYGDLLFKDVRGPDFPLDSPEAQGASVLVVGKNFGCGSSREHAVWAIQQAGYRAVIAKKTETDSGYSDIFRQNAANCGLLLIELPEAEHSRLVEAGSGASVQVDLERQTIGIESGEFGFEINPATKDDLIQGLDMIGTTLRHEEDISRYEAHDRAFVPPSQTIS